MLDRAQQPIRVRQHLSALLIEAAGGKQSLDCIERRGCAHRWVAPAVDHLLDLDEELDFPDSAAPALQVVTRPDVRALRKMIANPGRDLPHFLDHSKVER